MGSQYGPTIYSGDHGLQQYTRKRTLGNNKMKLAAIILGAILATALAEHGDMPNIQNMPNLNVINNFKDGKIPEIPPGMKISDLKEAFYNLPPSMKEKLNEMAQSFGMQLDDVEDALNNPPEKLREYFAKNGDQPQPEGSQSGPMGNINDLLKNVDIGSMAGMLNGVDVEGLMKNIDPDTINNLMQNMDMGAMGDIMKNMDMGAMTNMMKNMDINGIMKNVDINGIMKNMDLGAMGDIMKNVDVNGLMQNVDMGAMGDMMKNVDVPNMMKNMNAGSIGDMMKNVDMGAVADIMKNVDVAGIMKDMDMGPVGNIMKNMDLGKMTDMMKNMDMGKMTDIMKNMDMGAMADIMKNVDIDSVMKNMDMGAMGDIMKNMDMGAISDIMKNVDVGALMNVAKTLDVPSMMRGKFPSFDAIKSVFGIPEDASPADLKQMVLDKLNEAGVPLNSPIKLVEYIQEKVKSLPLPADMDPSDILNIVHGQLEAMGIPEDPAKMQEFFFKQVGLDEIKDIDELKDPEVLAKLMQKKALALLGLDENEDPMVVKDRIMKQLLEEAKKLGASLPDDYTKEEVMEEMDKLITKEVNEILGTDAKSMVPQELHAAVTSKLEKMGFPVHDFGAMKKHIINMAMKYLMKQAVPMVMNLFMPKPHPQPQMPPMMPVQMPPMMPPMQAMQPPTVPLNLDIEVNVEQPPMMTQMPMPRYLLGAEEALHHPHMDRFNDANVFQHIMAVRQALRYGEMPEDALQELVEDLMNARLKTRVMAVRNMFLRDRMAAMERELEMMRDVPEGVPMSSQMQDPVLKMMTQRVL